MIDPAMINQVDFVIIAVPTPKTKAKDPDMEPVESASNIVGQIFYAASFITSYRDYFSLNTMTLYSYLLMNNQEYL
ncbi:MAG TPA: hypothetical protein VMW77_04035 [Methanoregula sp.]|nr:hypothetical protein [Methanoregula sp.]